jgi:hypothetical protein
MPSRRDVMTLGASAACAALAGIPGASAAPAGPRGPTLQTRLFNFRDDVSAATQSDITSKLKGLAGSPGVDGVMVGRNFIPTPFPTRFEWLCMIRFGESPPGDPAAGDPGARGLMEALSSSCRNEVECELTAPLPAGFIRAAGVKVRHTVMFDFKPDASAEARARNVEAIRAMGTLPMVQHYVVARSAAYGSGGAKMEWQVIGDFASVDDFQAYSRAPAHLTLRDDFKAHTARVAFLDVEL